MKLSLTLGKRFVLFVCITLLCFVVTSAIVGFISYKAGINSTPMMRIAAVLQDLLLFILPAMVTALLITRLPATFLAVDRKPRAQTLLLAIATMIVSIPAMNMLISLNNSITFPESLKALEIAMRHAEDAAAQSVDTLIGGNSVPSMIVSVLIVGVLAGFSEELFFRGAFQRLLTTGNVNKHLAIWLVAFCFSAMHMQFFGFFPRMLLGAFFGYLLYWSGSLWLPIVMHALNNSMYIIGSWAVGGDKSALNTYDDDISIVFLSIVLTAAGIYLIHRSAKHKTLINLI